MLADIKKGIKKSFFKLDGRFVFPLFREEYQHLQKDIAFQGYAVDRNFLSKEEVAQLDGDARELIRMVGNDIDEKFWPSGRSADPAVRNFAGDAIERIIPKKLEKFFDRKVADMMAGTFLIKPTGQNSNLYPHQDSAHVDEEKYFAVYAWIPLCDVTANNGAMHVLPGSHLFENRQRSLNVPWQFDGLQDHMFDYLVPVDLKAGDILFFEEATIHFSSNNMSDDYRNAINYFIRPAETPFMHYYMDDQTPKGKVEAFNVTMDFFYNESFEERPPEKYPFLGYVDHTAFDLDEAGFRALCEKFRP